MLKLVGYNAAVSSKLSVNTPLNKHENSFKKLNTDVFVNAASFTGITKDPKLLIEQDMREYPVNQYYFMLLEEDFMSGKNTKFNDFGSVHDNEEAFFKWFSEEFSIGEGKKELEKIPIDGPTGCRTIWKAFKNKENAEALVPFMILLKDWAFNNENSTHPKCMSAIKKIAISDLKKRLGVKIDLKTTEDFHYEDYIKKKATALSN